MDNAIVTRFCIRGLYGYKNVEINFTGKQLILIAGNGSGKTTILNALYALLTRQHFRLRSLDFKSIQCDFLSGNKVFIEKEELTAVHPGVVERVTHLSRQAGVSVEEFVDFISNDLQSLGANWRYHHIVQSLFSRSPMDYEEILEEARKLQSELSIPDHSNTKLSFDLIAKELAECEILYLPTYRRIENPQLNPRGSRSKLIDPASRRRMETPFAFQGAQMNFGLEDVEERLNQLSEEVDRIANAEYRNASAAIIDDALDNKIDSSPYVPLPDMESLRRFLSRVSDSKNESGRIGIRKDWISERRLNAITELYFTGDVARPEYQFLRYFLSRLGGVIEKTKETEAMLQKFVDACNGYLGDSIDEKLFVYDPNLMRVAVLNSWTGKNVELSQLSSGEKQIVSILAKLHLYEKKKFVLIDEPELSLSIDWQRKILPDMLQSGGVRQLLAITHSPFVFENNLDPFAGPLQVSRERRVGNV